MNDKSNNKNHALLFIIVTFFYKRASTIIRIPIIKNIHNNNFLNNSADILSLINWPRINPAVATNVATKLGNHISEKTKTSVDTYPKMTGTHPTSNKNPMVSTNSRLGILADIR